MTSTAKMDKVLYLYTKWINKMRRIRTIRFNLKRSAGSWIFEPLQKRCQNDRFLIFRLSYLWEMGTMVALGYNILPLNSIWRMLKYYTRQVVQVVSGQHNVCSYGYRSWTVNQILVTCFFPIWVETFSDCTLNDIHAFQSIFWNTHEFLCSKGWL